MIGNKVKESKQPSDKMVEIFNVILSESERGALLLACHIVDNFLLEMISKNKNEKVSNSILDDTTNYGGAFGNLSAKSKSLFVLGILGKQTFGAIEGLRQIRNKAAHSANEFFIVDYQQSFNRALTSFGEIGAIENLATELAMKSFIAKMQEQGIELSDDIGENPFPDEQACVDYLAEKDELIAILEAQMPKWHLATLTFLIVETIRINFEDSFSGK